MIKFPKIRLAAKVGLLYLLFSTLWIIFSDMIVAGFTEDAETITKLQTSKGWLFVFLSAVLIFILIKREMIKQEIINQELLQNTDRFNSIVNNLLEGGQLIGFDWRYLYLNKVAEKHNRRPNETLLGKRVMDIWLGIEKQPVFHAEKICMEQRIPQLLENNFEFPDGTSGWFEIQIVPVPEGIFILSIDISERKKSETAILKAAHNLQESNTKLAAAYQNLELSEVKYRELFMNNPQPMWIYDLKTLAFLMVNDAAVHQYGYSHEEFLQMTLMDIRPTEEVDSLLENITTKTDEYQQSSPWQHRLKSGEVIFVEITSHELIYQGRKARFVMAQNITQRLIAESELRLQSAALNSAANSILITDMNGTIVWVNPAFEKSSGYSFAEAMGKTPGELIRSGVHNQEFYKSMWNTILEGNIWRGEIVNRSKNGTLFTVEESITPVMDSKGKITHFVSIRQDITDRKKAEKDLYESEERLRLALNATNQGLFDLNVQTGEAVVNDMYALMLGYDPEQFVETIDQWKDRLHPDDLDRVSHKFADYIQGKIPEYRVEFRQKTANGDWKWLLAIGKIVEYDLNQKPLRMLGTHTDITESKHSQIEIKRLLEESERRLNRLSALRNIDIVIMTNPELKTTLNLIIQQVIQHLEVDAASILLFDKSNQEFSFVSGYGFQTQKIQDGKVNLGESLAGKAAVEQKMLYIPDIEQQNIDQRFFEILQEEGVTTYLGLPLFVKGKLMGILEVFHRSKFSPTQEWFDFYETLGGQAAIAIENAQLFGNLQKSNIELIQAYEATITGWSMAMDLKDQETENHTLRVMELMLNLCKKLNFSEERLIHVRHGALLHDIGKMGVPDQVLLKTGKLTDEEWVKMREHPIHAYNMLYPIEYLRPALDIPYLHHERWNGSGYPLGLKGEEIPLVARLFAIIDVYDALTSDRPYREAWSREKTIGYIQENSNILFDPELVTIFLDYLNEEKST